MSAPTSTKIRRFALPLVAALALVAPPAAANVCERTVGGLATGPLPLGFGPGTFGMPRRACPRTEVFVGAMGGAVVEPQNFYGNLHGSALVGGSLALSPRLEVFGAIEPVLYRTVIASFSASHLGVGHSSLGATLGVLSSRHLVVGIVSQATLPTAVGYYKNAFPVGLESGVVLALMPLDFVRLYAQASGLGSFMVSSGDADPRAGLLAVGGGELVLADWVSLVGELRAQGLYDADLDALSAGAGVRARIWEGLAIEGGLLFPLAGRERSLGVAELRLSHHFSP